MIQAIAIDDEPPALAIIQNFCQRSGKVELRQTFSHLHKAALYKDWQEIDVFFLDINMPPESGIEWAIARQITHKTVFTTAFMEHAAEAFTINAIDYLVKPFSYERFLQALTKATKVLAERQVQDSIFLKLNNQYEKLLLHDILYIEAKDDYVKIHLEAGRSLLLRKTLVAIWADLGTTSFTRVHRSYIVNKTKVIKYGTQAVWIGGAVIPIGKNYKFSL